MNLFAHDSVAKLWNLCSALKDDGVTYHQYVIELTYAELTHMTVIGKLEAALAELREILEELGEDAEVVAI